MIAPKPRVQPKPKRQKKKSMTIAAGFFFNNGILLCADREGVFRSFKEDRIKNFQPLIAKN